MNTITSLVLTKSNTQQQRWPSIIAGNLGIINHEQYELNKKILMRYCTFLTKIMKEKQAIAKQVIIFLKHYFFALRDVMDTENFRCYKTFELTSTAHCAKSSGKSLIFSRLRVQTFDPDMAAKKTFTEVL